MTTTQVINKKKNVKISPKITEWREARGRIWNHLGGYNDEFEKILESFIRKNDFDYNVGEHRLSFYGSKGFSPFMSFYQGSTFLEKILPSKMESNYKEKIGNFYKTFLSFLSIIGYNVGPVYLNSSVIELTNDYKSLTDIIAYSEVSKSIGVDLLRNNRSLQQGSYIEDLPIEMCMRFDVKFYTDKSPLFYEFKKYSLCLNKYAETKVLKGVVDITAHLNIDDVEQFYKFFLMSHKEELSKFFDCDINDVTEEHIDVLRMFNV